MACDVSIIYVNYNTSGLIADSILTVLKNVVELNYEIIIVDNNTEKDLEKKICPLIPHSVKIQFIYLNENIGFGRANNEGAKYANGEYLILLNPDTLLVNNAIKILYDFMKENHKVGACGGNLIGAQNKPSFSFRKILPGPVWEFQELTHHFFCYPKNSIKRFYNFTDNPKRVAYISGANLMIKTSIYKKCGGFPEELFMYWDDVAICKKIKDLEYEIYNVPEARIIHLESQSFDGESLNKSKKIEFQEKYRHVYLKKYLPKTNVFIANFIYYLFLQSRIISLPKGLKQDYYRKRLEFYKKYKKSTLEV